MAIKQIVRAAMEERAPQLLAELKQSGNLEAFIQERSEQILSLTNSLAYKMAVAEGANEAHGMARVAIFNGALHHAREIVLAEQLEFQPEETSRPSQD